MIYFKLTSDFMYKEEDELLFETTVDALNWFKERTLASQSAITEMINKKELIISEVKVYSN